MKKWICDNCPKKITGVFDNSSGCRQLDPTWTKLETEFPEYVSRIQVHGPQIKYELKSRTDLNKIIPCSLPATPSYNDKNPCIINPCIILVEGRNDSTYEPVDPRTDYNTLKQLIKNTTVEDAPDIVDQSDVQTQPNITQYDVLTTTNNSYMGKFKQLLGF